MQICPRNKKKLLAIYIFHLKIIFLTINLKCLQMIDYLELNLSHNIQSKITQKSWRQWNSSDRKNEKKF